MDTCIFCSSPLQNKKQVMRARMRSKDGRPEANRITYKAFCPACIIYLRKTDQGVTEGEWRATGVTESELEGELTEAEFRKLSAKIEKELANNDSTPNYQRWIDFNTVKKRGDRIFRFIQREGNFIVRGYVIKRNEFLVAEFVHQVERITG